MAVNPNPEEMQVKFLEAYEAHSDAIFRHVYYRVFDRDKAKDLTQECFVRTWERIVGGAQIGNFRAFLYRTAVNLVIDDSRRRKAESLEAAMENGFEPAVLGLSAAETAEHRRVVAAIHRLEPAYREVLLMRHIEGLGPKDIAAALDESENAVSVRLHRGMAMLKDIFNR